MSRRHRKSRTKRRSPRARARGRQLTLVPAARHPCEVAWEKHVPILPGPPEEWFDVVEAFVGRRRMVDPDGVRALALLALSLAGRTWDDFRHRAWIGLVSPHVYMHFDGRGFGVARPLRVAARLVEFAFERDLLTPWQRARLLHEVEEARLSVGLPSSGAPPALDVPAHAASLERLGAELAAACPPGPLRAVAPSVVGLVASFVAPPGYRVHFGDLDPEEFVLGLDAASDALAQEPDGFVDAEERAGFHGDVLHTASLLYLELARRGALEPARARELAARLARLAAACAQGAAAA